MGHLHKSTRGQTSHGTTTFSIPPLRFSPRSRLLCVAPLNPPANFYGINHHPLVSQHDRQRPLSSFLMPLQTRPRLCLHDVQHHHPHPVQLFSPSQAPQIHLLRRRLQLVRQHPYLPPEARLMLLPECQLPLPPSHRRGDQLQVPQWSQQGALHSCR